MDTDKCSIEDGGDISVEMICSWWNEIHRGKDVYLDYINGAIMCSNVKYYHDLEFLFDVGGIIVEAKHQSSDTPALLRNQAS